jgi:hypothetical protein
MQTPAPVTECCACATDIGTPCAQEDICGTARQRAGQSNLRSVGQQRIMAGAAVLDELFNLSRVIGFLL